MRAHGAAWNASNRFGRTRNLFLYSIFFSKSHFKLIWFIIDLFGMEMLIFFLLLLNRFS